LCGWVNAKNGFGAYAGYQPFMVTYFVNEKSQKPTVLAAELEPFVVNRMCLKYGYHLTR